VKYGELAQHIGGVLSGTVKPFAAYFAVGQDDYLRETAKRLFLSAAEGDFADMNSSRFYADSAAAEVVGAANTFPILAEFRVVCYEAPAKLSDSDKAALKGYFEAPSPTTLFIIDCSADAAKALKSKGTDVIDCNNLEENELLAEAERICAQSPSVKIKRDAAAELVRRIGNSTARLVSEIAKLKSYCAGEITLSDVEAMVSESLDVQIFDLTKAVSLKDADKAFKTLERVKKNGIRSLTVINQLYDKYRKMLHAELHKELSNDELGKLFGMRGGAVYYLRQASTLYSQVKLKKCVDIIHALQCDVLSGRRSEDSALIEMMFELLRIGSEPRARR